MAIVNFILRAFILLSSLQLSPKPSSPPPPPLPQPPPPSSFDYAIVAFQWPMALCAVTYCKVQSRPQSFRLHGVWPTNYDGSPIQCSDSPFVYNRIKDIRSMNTYWPDYLKQNNKDFWEYEWDNHGVCSGQSVEDYFDNSLSLFRKKFNVILTALRQEGITPRRGSAIGPTVEKVYEAIKDGLALVPMLSCRTSGKNMYLIEVRLCADPNLKSFRDCPPKQVKGCGNFEDANEQKVLFFEE